MPDTSMTVHRETIYALAVRYHLPTIYGFRFYVTGGGLMSYGVDAADLLRGAATYVDRILRGAKPSELPVQLPTKFELKQFPAYLNRWDSQQARNEGVFAH
jgi:putative tryptophan/tyrosine transport system substrate-binding protein